MDFSFINIGSKARDFFEREKFNSFEIANSVLKEITGIVGFFKEEIELVQIQHTLKHQSDHVAENRMAYGDYQTNQQLTDSVCSYLKSKNIKPNILLEPTCGKGSFIMSAIQSFQSLQKIFGIEIQENYLWQLKVDLLDYFLKNPLSNKPQAFLYHGNVFDFDFWQIKKSINGDELLIIGNPPWVTNTALSSLESKNLPRKTNFKQTKGIDAITGKGNFDIGEFISFNLLDLFSDENGTFAFLIKNSVIKNIVFEQKKKKYPISTIEKHAINAKKEFDAAVDASLFFCTLNSMPEFSAKEFDFYTAKPKTTIGWVNNKFASDIEKYKQYQDFDGICPFEWRQGIKHDCAQVMELERIDGGFRNALGEEFELEEDLIYGIMKSSDLKGESVSNPRKFTIITQKKIGQDTGLILEKLPKTKSYLHRHKDYFSNRKSNIYNAKPLFSIFGVGDYSFKPYKVAISGLYKQTKFSLVANNGTIIMLDDTCYFIGFETYEDALITQFLLNKNETQEFMKSFMFCDAKRVITKELLMRININAIANNIYYSEIQHLVSNARWQEYTNKLFSKANYHFNLFE